MRLDKNTFKLSKIKNRARLTKAYKKGKTKTLAYPVELILEITNQCNLSCIMCPRSNTKRPIGMMGFDLFRNIIDQVKDYIELAYLSGGMGEPLMHPGIFDMIAYCRDSGIRVGVSTNATLLDSTIIQKLLKFPPDLMLFSLDGATKETHERIRVGSCFEKTMANVEGFLIEKEALKSSLPYAIAQMVYMPENQAEMDLFKKRWSKYKSLNDIRMKKFLHLPGAKYYPEEDSSPKKPGRCLCILPWRQISISWEGKVTICCLDYEYREEIGNVNNKPILELWNSEKMQYYRELLSSGNKNKIEVCKKCTGITTTSFLTRWASIVFDNLTIKKLLPIAEKLALKFKIKMVDYV